MKILFINPNSPAGSGRDLYTGDIVTALSRFKMDTKMALGLPLALPTLAAVTPNKHTVKIIDEMVDSIDFDEKCDLVGITAMTFKANRAYAIAQEFRKRGVPVIMGGIHASMCPEEAGRHVDCVVIGEAEKLWPKILDDFEKGELNHRYECKTPPDIAQIPPPRYDLTDHDKYMAFFLQTTRGCPYSCKFCTVTAFNGKALRRKSPQQVITEVEEILKLRKPPFKIIDKYDRNKRKPLATNVIFFTDDNFAIDRNHALVLCKALSEFQQKKKILLNWFTQVNYLVGLDDELLISMEESGCRKLFMGFESLSKETLKAMEKTMNTPERYASSIQNVKRHGIDVVFSIIVGGDYDTKNVHKEITEFVDKHNVFYVLPNILTPYPGTVLGSEMKAENRIVNMNHDAYNIRNAVYKPRLMTTLELQESYTQLCTNVFSFDRLLKNGLELMKGKQRYYLPYGLRWGICMLFSIASIRLGLRRKIRPSILFKVLLSAPRFIIFNGSLSALGFLAACVDFDNFADSERQRFLHYYFKQTGKRA